MKSYDLARCPSCELQHAIVVDQPRPPEERRAVSIVCPETGRTVDITAAWDWWEITFTDDRDSIVGELAGINAVTTSE